MAGLTLQTVLEDRAVRRAFLELAQAAAHTKPLMADIGKVLVDAAVYRFETGTDPEGEEWAPLSPGTLARRRNPDAPVLVQEAHLRDSLTYAARAGEVEVGSNLVYAAPHQFGSEELGIPARAFVGMDEESQDEIGRLALAFLEHAAR